MNNASYGSVSPSTVTTDQGSAISTSNNTITIGSTTVTATANSGYAFDSWTNNCGSTLSDNCTVIANFKEQTTPTTMQGMTSAYCASMATGATLTLTDTRDNNTYNVVKLGSPINNCFMQQNLRLGNGTTSYTLNSENSNLPSGTTFTLAAAQTSGSTDWSCSDDTSCTTSRTYATGNTNYGNYYSWYTATANTGTYSMSSGDATGSICPKGWRLLTGGYSGEWQTLNDTYNSGSTSSDSGLIASPLNLVRAGYYDSGASSQVFSGHYWSSTGSGKYAYLLHFGSDDVGPTSVVVKFKGDSVRCVAAS